MTNENDNVGNKNISKGINRGHIGDVYNTYLENPKEAIIIGELWVTKTNKKLVIKNIGNVDATDVYFTCSELDKLLNSEKRKFPIKSLAANTHVEFRIYPLTRDPEVYEVKWSWKENGETKNKDQTITKTK